MDTNSFFRDLHSFNDFQLLAQDDTYRPVPEDWFVVITDLEKSTELVGAGRYQDVNTVGAGTIVLVQTIFGKDPSAFVFGGDGATFLIPPNRIDETKRVLANYKDFCTKQFGFSLRVGVVAVRELLEAGQKLEVGKFAGAGGKCTAFIRGGGLAWADYTIKCSPRQYTIKASVHEESLPLEGLSCRWQPIPSGKGRILTLLVQPRLLDSTRLFDEMFNELRQILGGSLENSSPVKNETLKPRGFWSSLRKEWTLEPKKFSVSFFKRFLQILICQWAFRFRLPVPFEAAKYVEQIPQHSDYRKYDDMLRLVLDCTAEEIEKIKICLQQHFDRGQIFFGLFESSHALMTCLLENLANGGHIHLIDGSDGGYTLAAREMNRQKRGEIPETESETL